MNANKVVIDEFDLSNKNARSVVLNMIDNQINQSKIQFLSSWERDHSTSQTDLKRKIEALENKKKEIIQLFEEISDNEGKAEICLSFNVESGVQNHALELQSAEA